MNENGKTPETSENTADPQQANAAQSTAGPSVGGEGDALSALAAENAELKDRTLRVMAEMENLRRRTEKEIRDAKQYSVAGFARDMLAVTDNLRRALESLSSDARDSADEAMKGLIAGVEMTEREMLNQLEKHGVKKLDPQGQKFDPHFHQAMFEVPNPSIPANTVVQVMQAGYTIGDRVLRPALVGVSKGGPKEAGAANGDAQPGATVDKTA
ncbi:nucleotide exchange factor GrpE [Stappia sp. F7233]|uniref:Protein GrpE n=1 Tax=Stappia albiluteola TaxID=2758565 RepID=A0A839ABK8_9HYPH|nr:nucleotide exchange factor GrpE [Stappia albiluteola]MBA5776993.1 nucleotide exchange factor GrpE [Stappia albiluteola]